MPHATSRDGLRIHYRVLGDDGPPVVMLQGLGLSGSYWGDLTQTLLTKADPYRLVLVDNRGSGLSDGCRRPYRMGALADDVAAVLDHAAVESAFVVGVSMGGMIAQEVALRHPSRVRGLVLISTSMGLPHGKPPPASSIALLSTAPFALARGDHAQLFARMFFATRPPDVGRRLGAGVAEQWSAQLAVERMSLPAYFLQVGAILGHSTGSRLARIACPTHVAAGTDDVLVPPVNAENLARRIPGATLEMVAGAGHALPVEEPDVIRRALARVRETAALRSAA